MCAGKEDAFHTVAVHRKSKLRGIKTKPILELRAECHAMNR